MPVSILDMKIKNPDTDNFITVRSALEYDDDHKVKKIAQALIDREKKKRPEKTSSDSQSIASSPPKKKKTHRPKIDNPVSHKMSEECAKFLEEQGYTHLNTYPQDFVSPKDIIFNPNITEETKHTTWVAKFPFQQRNGEMTTKMAYTREFMQRSARIKYKKISGIKDKDIARIDKAVGTMLKSKNKTLQQASAVIGIIRETGLRVGSDTDSKTGNRGVRTLQRKHFIRKENGWQLSFIGKAYKDNIAMVTDETTVAWLDEHLRGKQDDDRAFDCSYDLVHKTLEKITNGKIHPKDLRTYKATQVAKQLLMQTDISPPPLNTTDPKKAKAVIKKKLKHVFTQVSEVLNNSPAMAKNSYIHPQVIMDFLKELGVRATDVNYSVPALQESVTPNEHGITDEDLYQCDEYVLPSWW